MARMKLAKSPHLPAICHLFVEDTIKNEAVAQILKSMYSNENI